MAYDDFTRQEIDPVAEENHTIETLFSHEIEWQCKFINAAHKRLAEADRLSAIEFWQLAQTMINAGATISKLLWGKDAEPARENLRNKLGIDDTSVFKAREIRNGFEHIDERIITAVRDSDSGNAFRIRATPNAIFDGHPGTTKFGEVRESETTVRFLDHGVDLEEIGKGAIRILDVLSPGP